MKKWGKRVVDGEVMEAMTTTSNGKVSLFGISFFGKRNKNGRKWKAGGKFKGVGDFSKYIKTHKVVYNTREKRANSVGWVVSWQYHYLEHEIANGVIVRAKEVK